MKICHIHWGMAIGGIETMLVNIANIQAEMGHEVDIVVINDLYDNALLEKFRDSITVHLLKRKIGSKSPVKLLKLNLLLRRLKADIYHFHDVNIVKYVRKQWIKPYCTTYHSVYQNYISGCIADNPRLFTISRGAHDDILEKTGAESTVVYNGIDTQLFKRRNPGPNHSPLRIVQVGRAFDLKGQPLLIEAVQILRLKGLKVNVDFIGGGPKEADYRALVDKLGLNDSISFLGSKAPAYIQEHLADYDLLVQPSLYEGFGLTIAEAMAAKVPVLVSDIAPQMELIDNGECGRSFRSGNPVALAKAIEDFIDGNGGNSTVERAYSRVCGMFDVHATTRNYLSEYERIIARNTSSRSTTDNRR